MIDFFPLGLQSIAIKNEPIYHYIMDGSGTSGQYLPVVTIGADGQLKAVTDPTCLPNHGSMQPVDIGEEVGINLFVCSTSPVLS